ncbi:Ribose-phosphate pyrophosphokinase 5 [Neolecta irregularis DAH-3]|uniref:ribose-phosphate diphosphokinase n=1 Tax=Neolecta irregularis (strain DAH-3) TaxID=1198029 RepID=A0A1U7LNB9_NEOID|nr:Ribose-phosphate pyrophosphokinase 5 [Neolecta irregularis DAH-3]|eukprot:OLL24021.1 Ribose-phosphate pyrophosphokinase 5 [Neolecta irregularis DAH-3]
MRNMVVLSGSSHPALTQDICFRLGIREGQVERSKFSNNETLVNIRDSVRGKDVYVVSPGCGSHKTSLNDNLMELLITISACKTASASKVTAVVPVFPYSRQPDIPYSKAGAPLARAPELTHRDFYSFNSRPPTPVTDKFDRAATKKQLNGIKESEVPEDPPRIFPEGPKTRNSIYREWVAQAGTLVAGLLTCAGADHIITMDLHDPQFQGFFDIPVDNLYGKPLLQKFITTKIPDYQDAVIVSPDAGGAKRATAIADTLCKLIPKKIYDRQNAHMMLVGDVSGKVAILIDDLVDTANTITRSAKTLKDNGATYVYGLVTHAILSGDAIERINASAIDRIIVSNTVPQDEHKRLCPKLDVLDVAPIIAEAIRRTHNGESVSLLFNYAQEV